MPWRAMDFEFETEMELEFMIEELFEKHRLLEYIMNSCFSKTNVLGQ